MVSLISIIVSVLMVDGLLRLFDPWGAVHYASDMRVLLDHIVDNESQDYTLQPGVYHLNTWTSTVNPDGTRLVPNTHPNAKCTIALVGDSVTFGYGVSDADTFANLLAIDYPDLNIVDTGVIGYNIENANQVIHTVRADGYVYLLIANDADPQFDWRHAHTGSEVAAFSLYLLLMKHSATSQTATVRDSFYTTLAKISQNNRVVVVGFQEPLAEDAAEFAPSVNIIPFYTAFNSKADAHPNAMGHKQIAQMLKPIVNQLQKRVCELTF